MFDIYTYPISFRNNLEYSNVPGYFICTPIRKSVRNRELDILVLKFSPYRLIDKDENGIILDFLAKTSQYFYKTNGPITTVSKNSAEYLNDLFLKLNQSKNVSEIINGSLQLLVIHDKEIYFTQCGNASSFVISKIRSMQFDEKISGSQGLGITKALKFKIYHAELSTGDRIVISNKTPSDWTIETLTEDPRVSISHLRKTLLQRTNQDFDAIILQVRTGTGNIHELKLENQTIVSTTGKDYVDNPVTSESAAEKKSDVKQIIQPVMDEPIVEKKPEINLSNVETRNESDQIPLPPFLEKEIIVQEKYEHGEDSTTEIISKRSGFFQKRKTQLESIKNDNFQNPPPIKENQKYLDIDPEILRNKPKEPKVNRVDRTKFVNFLSSIKLFLERITNKSESINNSISENTAKFISRTAPSSKEMGKALSPTSMFFIAFLVPILVVAIAMTVYFRSGRGQQHEQYVFQANELVTQANSEGDVTKRVVIYQDALLFLDEAEKFGTTETSEKLKAIIQKELDNLQGVTRIDLRGTVAGGIDRRMQISKMLINSGEDLYALDQGTGRVLRMVYTNDDFQVDTTFVCGPGNYDQVVVHELVDIESINISNSLQAVIIGIDRGGNLLLCSVNKSPLAFRINPPEMGWGDIKAIAFNDYSVYILDVNEQTRDLYRLPSNGLKFDENPESIFVGNIPENLTQVQDIAIYENELFLLHDSGELMKCTIGQAQTACIPNTGYGFILDGQNRQVSDIVSGVDFTQIQTTQPPDPSVFFMDSQNSAVYHYSLALNMQKQIRPNFIGSISKPEVPITAFTVSPYGLIHFAFGYQLYFGYLP